MSPTSVFVIYTLIAGAGFSIEIADYRRAVAVYPLESSCRRELDQVLLSQEDLRKALNRMSYVVPGLTVSMPYCKRIRVK